MVTVKRSREPGELITVCECVGGGMGIYKIRKPLECRF